MIYPVRSGIGWVISSFGKAFESEFVGQSETENRSITETLDKGWELLGLLPREELDRIDTKILDQYYHETVR